MSKITDIVADLKFIETLTSDAQSQIDGKASQATTYTKTEVATELAVKQDTLVSGTNIKTVGGQSLLGSGDIPTGTASGFTLLNTIQIAANTSVIYITLDNTYDSIKILMQGVSISLELNNGRISLQYSLDGTTYVTGQNTYRYTSTNILNRLDYSLDIVPGGAYGGPDYSMDINIYKQGMLQSFVTNPAAGNDTVVGRYNGSVGTGVQKVKIFPSAGVFDAGEIKVIGVKYV